MTEILTAGEESKNTEILFIKLKLNKTSGELYKNNPYCLAPKSKAVKNSESPHRARGVCAADMWHNVIVSAKMTGMEWTAAYNTH